MDRCGKCKNCLDLERVRKRVLACCNPPFSHADQDVADVWNSELERLKCLRPSGGDICESEKVRCG